MSWLRIVQIDVPEQRLDAAVAFWAAALSAEPTDAPGAFVHLVDATSALEVHIQSIGDDPPRYHLDLEADDRDREVARLVTAGGAATASFDADGYTVLSDPAGVPLCVIDPTAAAPTRVAPRRPDRGYLGAVVLDVPEQAADRTVGFWSSALGLDPRRAVDTPPFRELPGVVGPGGGVQLLVQSIGRGTAARVHVDLIAPDTAAEVHRLEALGAHRIGEHVDWTTLRDPVGNLLCVVSADAVAATG